MAFNACPRMSAFPVALGIQIKLAGGIYVTAINTAVILLALAETVRIVEKAHHISKIQRRDGQRFIRRASITTSGRVPVILASVETVSDINTRAQGGRITFRDIQAQIAHRLQLLF